MRMMPKIRVSPTPRKNNSAACDSAFRLSVTSKAARSTAGEAPLLLEGLLVARRRGLFAWIRCHNLRHRLRKVLALDRPHHEAVLHRLMVAFAHRDTALDVVDRDGFERVMERHCVGALGLLDRRGEDLQGLPLLTFKSV